MPEALNEVFWVNDVLEDIGGLVDVDDTPEGLSSAGGDGGTSHAGGNEANEANEVMPVKKTFITSRPGTEGGSSTVPTQWTRQVSATLAEKLLSSISPDTEALSNDNKAVMHLYLQQIRALEDTVWMRELQNDALRQELAKSQDKLHTTIRELNRAERRADRLEMRLDMMEMMGTTHRGRSSQHRPHHKHPASSSSSASSRHSRSPSLPKLKSRRHHTDSPSISGMGEKGKGVEVRQDEDTEEMAVAD